MEKNRSQRVETTKDALSMPLQIEASAVCKCGCKKIDHRLLFDGEYEYCYRCNCRMFDPFDPEQSESLVCKNCGEIELWHKEPMCKCKMFESIDLNSMVCKNCGKTKGKHFNGFCLIQYKPKRFEPADVEYVDVLEKIWNNKEDESWNDIDTKTKDDIKELDKKSDKILKDLRRAL